MKQLRVMPIMVTLCLLLLFVTAVGLVNSFHHPTDGKFEVYLGDYKHLTATVDVGEITDQVVEDNLLVLLQEKAVIKDVKDGAANGDCVVMNYEGRFEGETEIIFNATEDEFFIGGEQNKFPVTGLDQHLLGVKPNQVLTVTLTVQDNYHVANYAGKQVRFTITVNSVKRTVLPELDDAFAKTQGFDTVAALRQSMRDRLEVIQSAANDMIVRQGVWQQAMRIAKVLDPKTEEVTTLKNNMLNQIKEEATLAEVDMLGYATFFYQFDGTTEEELDAWATNLVWKKLKEDMVTNAICRKEGITLSEQTYQTMIKDAVQQNVQAGFSDYTKENLIEDLGVTDEEGLKEHFRWILVTDRLLETATIIKQ